MLDRAGNRRSLVRTLSVPKSSSTTRRETASQVRGDSLYKRRDERLPSSLALGHRHRCYRENKRPDLAVAPRKTNILRQGPLRPRPGPGHSFSSFPDTFFHFVQRDECGLSCFDLPLPFIENSLVPIRNRHVVFVFRKRSPDSFHCSELFFDRHLIQRQYGIHSESSDHSLRRAMPFLEARDHDTAYRATAELARG